MDCEDSLVGPEIRAGAVQLAAEVEGLIVGTSQCQLLTFAEAAERLRCCKNTVRNLVDDGTLVPTWVTPRTPRLSEAQIAEFVSRRTGPQ